MLRQFGAWCWLLRLPLVWWQRNSPRSRYGTLRLDLFTSGKRLALSGEQELRSLAPWAAVVSPDDGVWSHVPRNELPYLAGRVVHAAVRPGNCDTIAPRFLEAPAWAERRGPARVIEMDSVRRTSLECVPAAGAAGSC